MNPKKQDNAPATQRICFVTGGAGFIGCALSHHLVRQFDRVLAIDSLHPQVHGAAQRPDALHEDVELLIGDVTDAAMWDALLAVVKPSVVVHLAAETGTGQSLLEGSRHALVNVVGTTVMLDAFARHGAAPDRIILTSSRAVYGEGAWRSANDDEVKYPGQRTREQLASSQWDFPGYRPLPFSAATTMANPVSIYGATKLAQEHIVRAWSRALGVDCVVLRLQNVYGPGQSLKNPYTGICSYFAQLARDKRSIPLYEDGQIVRDFIFVGDVAEAILASLHTPIVESIAYDIGCGSPTTIAALAKIFAGIYDAPEPVITSQYRHGDVRHAACSIERAQRDLAWSPKTDLREGITRLCRWTEVQKQSRLKLPSAA